MTGKTLGFVKERAGLFLFLVDGTSTSAVNCFVPACQFTNVQIGPPLGAMLVEKHAVSAATLALALNEQAKLRQERIGKYLTDRALVSASQLMDALRQQGTRPNVRLGEVLIEEQLITSEQLAEALAIQGTHRQRRIGDILIDMGAVSTRLIQFALSDKLGIPYVNAREFQIGPGALESVDTEFAIRHQVLPVLLMGESLVVAVENPLDIDFAQDLRFRTGMSIAPVIGNPQELKVRIAKEYSSLAGRMSSGSMGTAATSGDLRNSATAESRVADLASQLARERPQSSRDTAIDSRVSDNTLVKLVNKIIVEAHAQGASDIHIESNLGKGDTLIRFRKDGDLENYLALPQAYSNSLVSRVKIMADLDISEHRHPQDGRSSSASTALYR